MKSLEIISLRASGPFEKEARKYMKKFCRIVKKHSLSEAVFYVHASIPGDLALVISSQSQEIENKGTYWGIYMADVLKQFGLVDYNCWLMIENQQYPPSHIR